MNERKAEGYLHDPFGRSQRPEGFTREERINMLIKCALSLLDGELPEEKSRLFLAGGLLNWLQNHEGDLIKDHWKIAAPRGSHNTPQKLAGKMPHGQ